MPLWSQPSWFSRSQLDWTVWRNDWLNDYSSFWEICEKRELISGNKYQTQIKSKWTDSLTTSTKQSDPSIQSEVHPSFILDLHKLNDKVDSLTKFITKPNFSDLRTNLPEGPLNVPFINPSAQSYFMSQGSIPASKPSSAALHQAPHMRSEVLTNHVWVRSNHNSRNQGCSWR